MARKSAVADDDVAIEPPTWDPGADQPEPAPKPAKPVYSNLRDEFVNRCLWNWGVEQFLADRGCDPAEGHVLKLVEKAERVFDRLFAKRPLTSNLR